MLIYWILCYHAASYTYHLDYLFCRSTFIYCYVHHKPVFCIITVYWIDIAIIFLITNVLLLQVIVTTLIMTTLPITTFLYDYVCNVTIFCDNSCNHTFFLWYSHILFTDVISFWIHNDRKNKPLQITPYQLCSFEKNIRNKWFCILETRIILPNLCI